MWMPVFFFLYRTDDTYPHSKHDRKAQSTQLHIHILTFSIHFTVEKVSSLILTSIKVSVCVLPCRKTSQKPEIKTTTSSILLSFLSVSLWTSSLFFSPLSPLPSPSVSTKARYCHLLYWSIISSCAVMNSHRLLIIRIIITMGIIK